MRGAEKGIGKKGGVTEGMWRGKKGTNEEKRK